MWWFWILAGVMAAGAALLVAARAAAAARDAGASLVDPALSIHARQLAELDELARRGVLAPEELDAARTEAGRRLLRAADRPPAAERSGSRRSRLAVTATAAATALAALGLYVALGRPGFPDIPYRARLAAWRGSDPARLDPAQMAAVLRSLAATRPRDPQVFDYLGRAQLAAGQSGEAAEAFAHAARLAPSNADYPAEAGEALMEGAGGKVSPEAEVAFRQAIARDPKNASARFQLARLRMAQGDPAGGLTAWRTLLSDLPDNDPRRPALAAEIARAEGPDLPVAGAPLAGGPTGSQVAQAAAALAGGGDQAAFIRGMVDSLAQRLASKPEDVDGWARLVRAYRVLGDTKAQAAALVRARTVFARRPADLARIEAER